MESETNPLEMQLLKSSTTFKSSKSALSEKMAVVDHDPLSNKTPQKPVQLPRRTRNRGAALSVKEVRMMAQGINKREKKSSDVSDLSPLDQIDVGSSPQKTPKAKSDVKLPEKYELLAKFFHSLQSSIRLLRLKGSALSFSNICPKIETLTDRKFSYCHLAQLKHILPEAILIKKILLHDERTLRMKPDLQITLKLDAFKNSGKEERESGYSILAKVMHARLLAFFNKHPEGDKIPEAALPEPFNETKPCMNIVKTSRPSLPVAPSSANPPVQPTPISSHLSQSFARRFSVKTPLLESEKTHVDLSTSPLKTVNPTVQRPSTNETSSDEKTCVSTVQSTVQKTHTIEKSLTYGSSSAQLPPSSPVAIYEAEIKPMKNEDFSPIRIADIAGTPASTPSTVTPALQTPKRCRVSPDDEFSTPNKPMKQTRARLIFQTPVKDDVKETGRPSADSDIINFLPQSLLQSVREKERKAMEERNAGIAEAKWRRQMIACLPKLVNMIQLIFQSTKRSVITKQELMHKIIVNCGDIADRREVGEQLKLLKELLPDWINEKMSSSGDIIFSINQVSTPESLHARLAEAE